MINDVKVLNDEGLVSIKLHLPVIYKYLVGALLGASGELATLEEMLALSDGEKTMQRYINEDLQSIMEFAGLKP